MADLKIMLGYARRMCISERGNTRRRRVRIRLLSDQSDDNKSVLMFLGIIRAINIIRRPTNRLAVTG